MDRTETLGADLAMTTATATETATATVTPPKAPPMEVPQPETLSPASTEVDKPGRPAARPRPRPRATESLFRVVWRWHFYAGMIIAPVLIMMSVTGGLYIFRSEIEEFAKSDLLYVTPKSTAQRVSYQAQVDAAVDAHPGFVPSQLQIHNDPRRATLINLRPAALKDKPPSHENARRSITVAVNPYDGKVRGSFRADAALNTFFVTVLTIHRTLWAGTTGRILTELTTSWSFVLIITGVYLWWPRKKAKAAGVWTIRWKTKLYTRLRDLHSVGGFYLIPVCGLIVATGMFYTLAVGTAVHKAAEAWVGHAPEARPSPKTRAARKAPAPAANALPLDQLVAVVKAEYPDRLLFVALGPGGRRGARQRPENSLQISAGNDFNRTYGPIVSTEVSLDKSTGRVLKRTKNSEEAFFWHAWTYPLHVGSFWGIWTKVLWFIACVVLTVLPITGLWMWWERRPRGQAGLPRRPDVRVPRWLAVLIVALSVILPILGASLVAILMGEGVVSLVRRFRRPIAGAA